MRETEKEKAAFSEVLGVAFAILLTGRNSLLIATDKGPNTETDFSANARLRRDEIE